MPEDSKPSGNTYIHPPGTYQTVLGHPSGRDAAVYVAVVHEHRFAFYYWLKWVLDGPQRTDRPVLVTFDWHQDLVPPAPNERQELEQLNQNNPNSVALFCWGKLRPANDSHVLSAAYLNLIGDVYVVCKHQMTPPESLLDCQGNAHRIRCFGTKDQLFAELKPANPRHVVLDVDLDYFTESKNPDGGGPDVELVSDDTIKELFNADTEFMKWVFERFVGMTIAMEPEFCGGLRNSHHIFGVIDDALFRPPLLRDGCQWKHLRQPQLPGAGR